MDIYLVKRKGAIGPDENVGHVIVASSTREAIKIAAAEHKDESVESWYNESDTFCIGMYLGNKQNPHVVLTSFNNG